MPPTLDEGLVALSIRVTPAMKADFEKRAIKVGRRPAALGRELIEAFVQGRVTITPPTDPLYEGNHAPGN